MCYLEVPPAQARWGISSTVALEANVSHPANCTDALGSSGCSVFTGRK
jgi:hypothetical protein